MPDHVRNDILSYPAIDSSVFNLSEVAHGVTDPDTGEEIAKQLGYPFNWTNTSNPYIETYHVEDGDEVTDCPPSAPVGHLI